MGKNLFFFVFIFIASINHHAKVATVIKSPYDFNTTLNIVQERIEKANLELIAKIDHSKSAVLHSLSLSSSVVLLFGHPLLVNSIMVNNPIFSLFFPLHIALYEDTKGVVWIATMDLMSIERDYGLDRAEKKLLKQVFLQTKNIINIE